MANDRNDFDPSIRNQALWASDSRKLADGKADEVYLERIGQTLPKDLSDIEAVQWGHHLQDPIMRVAAQRMGVELVPADYMLTHSQHNWMRSHFDAIVPGGNMLVEIKAYGSHQRKYYGDDGSQVIKAADKAQLVHEAAVHNVSDITLAVLFGGQELCLYPFHITESEKDEWIQQLAVLWGNIVTKTPPNPTSSEAAAKLFPVSTPGTLLATKHHEQLVAGLKEAKQRIKDLEIVEDTYKTAIQAEMRGIDTLVAVDGTVLATWKSAKSSMTFSKALLEQAMPDIYKQFVVETAGSRRFLVK